MMLLRKTAFVSLTLLCVLVYGASVFRLGNGQILSVDVDLASPQTIVSPCEVSVVGDMGEKGLRIPPKVGSGWKNEAGGEATYRFYVPEPGRYYLWANALWFDKCTNAVFAQIDNEDKAVLGNDPIYKKWHWVRGFAVTLATGPHALTLSNHSDHISLQRILLMNSRTAMPGDGNLVFSDLFYDGFDGCHIGNFASWKPLSGEWEVTKPDAGVCHAENALVGQSHNEAIILYESSDWSDYSYHVMFRFDPMNDPCRAAGALFGVQDHNQYHRVLCRATDAGRAARWEVARCEGQSVQTLAIEEARWDVNFWHEVEIELNEGMIIVCVDDVRIIETTSDRHITGGIGLYVRGQATASFDEIHVRTVLDDTGSESAR